MSDDPQYERWLANLNPSIRQHVEKELESGPKPGEWFAAIDAVDNIVRQDEFERLIHKFKDNPFLAED